MAGAEPAARLIGWLVVAVVGALMLTQAVGWSGTRLVAVLHALTPYLIVALVPVAALAWWRRLAPLAFTAAIVGMSGLLLASPLVFPPGQPGAEAGATGLRVAAINLLYENEDVDEVADDLFGRDLDVIVFSEYTVEHQTVLTSHRVVDRYPHRVERDGLRAGGVAVWSRFPLVEDERRPTRNYSIDALVDGPDGIVRLFAVHPPTPTSEFEAWRRDLDLIRARADEAVEPTLLIGDFNASYWHPDFRDLLTGGFVDAHMAHGRGFSTSWPTGGLIPPFVRLDHALTGNGLVSTGVGDFDVPGSDHRGLVVSVAPSG